MAGATLPPLGRRHLRVGDKISYMNWAKMGHDDRGFNSGLDGKGFKST